jgi:serine/threonine protein kinase
MGRLGPYRVLQVLGQGGMGVVLLAEDPRLHRKVALKAMLPGLAADPHAKERFLREARAAAAVEHDHVIAIHQVDEDRGVPYIAMPLLKGQSLEDRLGQGDRLPIQEALRIARETAEGLAAAHEAGLIHRDIKPANIWLEGQQGKVKVLDFGLARSNSGGGKGLTQVGAILGTPAYMAPEQAQNQADARSDLFSLGCVLYRTTTGRPPFQGTDMVATLMAVVTQEPAPPHEVVADVPPGVSKFIMRLLAKDAADRPQSARAVVQRLRKLEQGAQAEGTERPLSQGRRRGPPWLLFGAAGIILAATGVGLVILLGPKRTPSDSTPLALGPSPTSQPAGLPGPPTPPPSTALPPPPFALPSGLLPPRSPEEAAAAQRAAAIALLKSGVFLFAQQDGNRQIPVQKVEQLPPGKMAINQVIFPAPMVVGRPPPGKPRGRAPMFPVPRTFEENVFVPLEDLEGITMVQMMGCRVGHALHHLARARELKNLALDGTQLDTDSLKPLSWFPKLLYLHLIGSNATDEMLAAIPPDSTINSIKLVDTQVGDVTLSHLSKLSNLRDLDLTGTKITDTGLLGLERKYTLTELNLSDTATGDKGLRTLKELTKLRSFGCGQQTTDKGLAEFLRSMRALEGLHATNTKVTGEGLEELSHLKSFQFLYLDDSPVNDVGLQHLGTTKTLTYVSLIATPISDKGLAHLAGLTRLTHLYLDETAVTDEGLAHLVKLPVLNQFSVRKTRVTKAAADRWNQERMKAGLPECVVFGATP